MFDIHKVIKDVSRTIIKVYLHLLAKECILPRMNTLSSAKLFDYKLIVIQSHLFYQIIKKR